jgi:hypothetical protein
VVLAQLETVMNDSRANDLRRALYGVRRKLRSAVSGFTQLPTEWAVATPNQSLTPDVIVRRPSVGQIFGGDPLAMAR